MQTKSILLALLAATAINSLQAATTTAPATTAPAPAVASNAAAPITDPNGEIYNAAVMEATKHFSHREALSAFTAAMLVPVSPAGAKQASVCLQKIKSKDGKSAVYRSHSSNASARGIVTSAGDLAAFEPLFQLNKGDKFILNVPQNLDGTGPIVGYIGQLFLKDGDGKEHSDSLCYTRYLEPTTTPSVAATAATTAATTTAATTTPAAAPTPAPSTT